MIYSEKNITLKNGEKVVLKTPETSDAEKILRHVHITAKETYFLARYPEEVTSTAADWKERIETVRKAEDSFCFAAYVDGQLIGLLEAQSIRRHLKYCHRCGMGISIQQKYCDGGLGTVMMREMQDFFKNHTAFEQIELGVYSDNERAKHLYEKLGFRETGIMPHAFKLKDGTYRDEIQMVFEVKR